MKRTAVLCLVLCLLFSGCSTLFDGSYFHEEQHLNQGTPQPQENTIVSNYTELCGVLTAMIENGIQSNIISVAGYEQTTFYTDMGQAVAQVRSTNPIAAWAVEQITWELGQNGGQPSVSLNITYLHDRTEIQNIHQVPNMGTAKRLIADVLDDCGSGILLLIPNYSQTDFQLLVDSYASTHPQSVMECPQVVVNVYPETGDTRLVDLKFTYQTSRDSLRSMQKQVRTVFESAALYVSSYSKQSEKYEQLYAFLMDFLVEGDYQLETSITPAYSLLRHGIGDKKAFATVYAAMCQEAGLNCQVITGTRDGEPWVWNLISIDNTYRHLDLLRCNEQNGYAVYPDSEMEGYVWDFSAHPSSE